jgi:hypothetical protein
MFDDLKDDSKYQWTNHVKDKMGYYRISPSMVKRIVRFPKRTEEGVAPNTVAVMNSRQSMGKLRGKIIKKVEEIWVMYQESNRTGGAINDKSQTLKERILGSQPKKKIISAWRYPGTSLVGKKIPIPDDILAELESGNID